MIEPKHDFEFSREEAAAVNQHLYHYYIDIRSWADNFAGLYIYGDLGTPSPSYITARSISAQDPNIVKKLDKTLRSWPAIHSTFEQSRPVANPLMPPLDSCVARLD